MKLNLGCGKNYKAGFINIDLFDKTVCDKESSVSDLDYKSDSVDVIEADQLIEHLGYIKSIYALCEWFRILKAGGTLIIETPDIEKSFRKYLDLKDHKKRLQVLNWIFGHESPGYHHLFCFDYKTLKELLMRIGFTSIKQQNAKTHLYEHSIRVSCKKPHDNKLYLAFAEIRRNAHDMFDKIISNQILAIELHLKLDIARLYLADLAKDKQEASRKKILDKVFISLCKYSPKLCFLVFDVLEKYELMAKNETTYKALAKKSIACSFVEKQYSLLMQLNKKSDDQSVTLKTTDVFAENYLNCMLGNKSKSALADFFDKLKPEDLGWVDVFSVNIVNDLANTNLSKSVKCKLLNDQDNSAKFRQLAESLNSDIKQQK